MQKAKKKASKRQLLKAWHSKKNQLFDLLKSSSDPETFSNDEKLFYQDQKAMSRKMALNDKIDEEHEAELQLCSENVIEDLCADETSLGDDGACGPADQMSLTNSIHDTMLVQSQMRSGRARLTKFI